MNTHLDARTLSSYLDDMLSKSERAQADLHLKSCAQCRAMLADFQDISKMFRELPGFAPPELEVSAVQEPPLILPKQQRRPFRPFTKIATAAAVILALGLGGVSYFNLTTPTVVYASQPDGAKNVPTAPDTPITLKFSEPMQRYFVQEALTIEPDTDVLFDWQEDGKTLQLWFPAGLKPNASYTISIAKTAKDAQGFALKEPFVIHFDTFSGDKAPAPQEPAQEFKLVKTQPLGKWTSETARPVQEQVNNGAQPGRLVADHAAMDDLFTGGILSPQEYGPPAVIEAGSTKALVRFDKKDGTGYALATVEKLVQQDQHGAWFTTQVDFYE
ncbi:Ig-like domain-containing protein [Tumebacillus avium]|nr:Ig-like domain-containing protein [Tumebacillus avium]